MAEVLAIDLASDDAASRTTRAWRGRIFLTTWLAYAGYYFCRKNFSVAMPLMKSQLGFTTDQLAWILVAYNACYMLGQFGNGFISARIGPRLLVSLGIGVVVLANLAMGFAASASVFFLIAVVHGAAQATGWPGTCQIMANWYPTKRRGVAMAWWSTNYILGGFLATLFATWCITNANVLPAWGFRRGFFFPAVILTAIGLVFTIFARSSPREQTHRLHLSERSRATKEEILTLLRKRSIWIAGTSYFFVKLTRYALLFWLPLYLTEALHYSTRDAGNTSSIFELVGVAGTLAAGYASDKLFRSRRFPVGTLMLIGLALVCLFEPLLSSIGVTGMAIAIGLMGFMLYGPDSLISGVAAIDLGNERTAALATGIVNGMGSAGQLISPLIVAWISQRYGWSTLFQVFIACAVLGAMLLATEWRRERPTVEGRRVE